MGFSVVIVVSDAGPVHLSAGSPSTGCDNLPKSIHRAENGHQRGQITLCQVRRRTSAGFPLPRTVAAPRTVMTPANTKWAYEEITHSDRNADADHWHELPR